MLQNPEKANRCDFLWMTATNYFLEHRRTHRPAYLSKDCKSVLIPGPKVSLNIIHKIHTTNQEHVSKKIEPHQGGTGILI
jgi:hypothetical protein